MIRRRRCLHFSLSYFRGKVCLFKLCVAQRQRYYLIPCCVRKAEGKSVLGGRERVEALLSLL